MKNYKLIIAVGFLFIAMGIFGLLLQRPNVSSASVDNDSGGYLSTTTPYAGQIGGTGGVTLLKGTTTSSTGTVAGTPNSYGIFGSVTITGYSKSGSIQLYDATTSNITLRGNVATSTILLADITGVASTTLTFDAVFTKGLLLVTTGSVPTSTITWK